MSTTKGECPQPSDAAMAAAFEIWKKETDDDSGCNQSVVEIAAIIAKHEAPLREELARANADLHYLKIKSDVLEDIKMALRNPGTGSYVEWAKDVRAKYEVATALRASNDKLRAALEEIASYDKNSKFGDGVCPYGCDCPNIARAAIDQAMTPSPNNLPHA